MIFVTFCLHYTLSQDATKQAPLLGRAKLYSSTCITGILDVFHPLEDLLTQWRNFARGCPWARDGWVPHWLRSVCVFSAKCKKSKGATRASLAAWGPGARLKAPVGSRGKAPGGGPGGEAQLLCISMQKQHFSRKLIRKIVTLKTLLQTMFSHKFPTHMLCP